MPSYAGPPVASRPGEVTSTLRLLVYLVLAVVLIALDSRGGWLSQVRLQANLLIQPIWAVAGLPGRIGSPPQRMRNWWKRPGICAISCWSPMRA